MRWSASSKATIPNPYLFEAIRQLMAPPEPKKRKIGFLSKKRLRVTENDDGNVGKADPTRDFKVSKAISWSGAGTQARRIKS